MPTPGGDMTSGTGDREKTFFGHPRGLATLFGTEMWERFSWYGLRAILATFMAASPPAGGLGLTEATAQAIVGIYGALIYLVALPGGWIADRSWAPRRSVLWGGLIIMCGHISMAVPVSDGRLRRARPVPHHHRNRPAEAEHLHDGRQALSARTTTRAGTRASRIFYMGINLGAFLAPIVVGWLAAGDRWHLGFGAAAVGMALGLLQYVRGRHRLRGVGDEPGLRLTPEERRHFGLTALAVVAVIAVALAAWVASGTFSLDAFALVMTLVILAVPVLYFGYILLGATT